MPPSKKNIKKTLTPKKNLQKDELQKIKIKKIAQRPLNLYRKIAFSFILLTALLLIVIFYFSFVKLTIILIPSQERISDSLIFDVYNKEKNNESILSKEVLSGLVEQIEIAEKQKYSSNGVEVIGEGVVGKVTIINQYNKNQPLVASTRLLSSSNKLFRLKNTVNVPAGGSVEAEVYADEPSEDMAINPTKFTIPGLWAGLQDKIYAQSNEKFLYKQQIKKYIQQSDIDQAVRDIKRGLITKAENDFGKVYKGYDRVLYSIDENTISTEIEGKVGEEKNDFEISIKAIVIIVAFIGEQVEEMAKQKLSLVLSDDKKLIEFNQKEIVYDLNNVNINQGIASVNASFEGKMTLREGSNIIDRDKIVGLTRKQLEDYLSGFKEIAGYEINLSPSFVEKVPNLADRIKIKIKN